VDDGLPTNTIFSSFENKNDGRMWFITYGFGLVYYDEVIGKFKCPAFNQHLIRLFNKKFINSCQFDKDNTLWITYHYVDHLKVDKDGKITIYSQKETVENSGFEIIQEKDITLVRNIYGIKPIAQSSYSRTNKGNKTVISGNITYNMTGSKLLRLNDSTLVLSYSNELLLINGSDKIKVKKMPSKVLTLILDKENNIWMGTEKDGIYIIYNSDFNSEPVSIHKNGNMPVSSILQDGHGKIWFTTLTNGIYSISNSGIRNFQVNKKIQKIFNDKNGLTLISSSGTIYRSMNDTFRFIKNDNPSELKEIKRGPDQKLYLCKVVYNKYIPQKLDIKNIAANTIEFFEKTIVIGGKTNLVKYNYDHKFIKKYDIPSPIFKICKVDSNKLLTGCLNGLYLFWNEKFTPVKGPDWLKSTRINNIINHKDKYYILTDGKGILVYQKGKLTQVIQRKGLPLSSVNCMAFENDSIIWIGASQGILKVKIDQKAIITLLSKLTVNDGLPSNEINDIIIISEKLLVATNNGLSVFNKKLKQTHKILPLFISTILGNFKDTLFYGYSRDITLDIDKKWRNLYIKFSINRDKSNGLFGQINYRLLKDRSIINDWTKISDNNVQFTNLEPGNYKFEIRTFDDILSEYYISILSFRIQPHFTEIIWVRALFLGFIFVLLAIGIWLLINKIRYDSEIKRKMIIAEINSLRNQMNPHFIFNALNSVQYFIFENNQEQAAKFLSKFATLIRKSLEFSKLNFISIRAEINFIEEYLEIEKLRFNNKFNYTIELDPALNIDHFFIPPLLMHPLIENSIKHGFNEKTENGKIWIKLSIEEKDLLTYSVKDNGKGIKASTNIQNGYKTSLSHEILKERFILLQKDFGKNKLIGMTVHNMIFENSYGTEIILKLPIKYD